MDNSWFVADKNGLRAIAERLVERRGFGILAGELYQNVRDTEATICHINITSHSKGLAKVTVEDNDPNGFVDLSHAWTLFAPSIKKMDPTKAGRFNIGEKMVLSFCQVAQIHTTSGFVEFYGKKRNEFPRRKREAGTLLTAIIECNLERMQQFIEYLNKVMVKPGLQLTVNGVSIPTRKPIHVFEHSLRTEIGEHLKATIRKTKVEIYEPISGEPAGLYELGIPVVETGDKWDVNISQKIPLNSERDNVTPAFLQSVRVCVLNEMHNRLEPEDVQQHWVAEAADHKDCANESITTYLNHKYGKNRVAFDPSDMEANKVAVWQGFTVIPSRGLTSGQRENAYRAEALNSAGKLFHTPKPFSDDPNAPLVEYLPLEEWTTGMVYVKDYAIWLAKELMGINITVLMAKRLSERTIAAYGDKTLYFSLKNLGKNWFDTTIRDEQDALLLHEFGHEYCSDHLSHDYHRALEKLGVKMRNLAIVKREAYLQWLNRKDL
jgi:hypothetical protein